MCVEVIHLLGDYYFLIWNVEMSVFDKPTVYSADNECWVSFSEQICQECLYCLFSFILLLHKAITVATSITCLITFEGHIYLSRACARPIMHHGQDNSWTGTSHLEWIPPRMRSQLPRPRLFGRGLLSFLWHRCRVDFVVSIKP